MPSKPKISAQWRKLPYIIALCFCSDCFCWRHDSNSLRSRKLHPLIVLFVMVNMCGGLELATRDAN